LLRLYWIPRIDTYTIIIIHFGETLWRYPKVMPFVAQLREDAGFSVRGEVLLMIILGHTIDWEQEG
jgi:hypothetical protein